MNKGLFEIPNTWNWAILSDIGSIAAGGTPSTKEDNNFNGDISWLTPADLSSYTRKYISRGKRNLSEQGLKNSSAVLLPKGSILFSSRAPIGYVVIAENSISTNQGFKNITVFKPIFNEYVYYYLKASKSLAKKNASGTTFLEISARNFSNLPIPIPPLPEQHRIVAKIEELFTKLDAGLEALKQAQAQLKRYRQSVLKAAVEGRLTAEWRKQHLSASLSSAQIGKDELEPADKLLERILKERREKWEADQLAKYKAQDRTPPKNWQEKYKEPTPPDTSNLPELPEGWTWCNIEQLAQAKQNAIKAGPFGSSLKKSYYVSKGYKIYGQEQVLRGDPSYGDYYIDKQKYHSLKSCEVAPGDILISLVGTIGEVLILPKDTEPGIINPRLLKLSLDEGVIMQSYFKTYLQSPSTKSYFKLVSHGGTMDILNLTILKKLPIPLPPIKEQKFILDEMDRQLSIADEVDSILELELNRAQSLRQSILKHAFEGKLVPQDQNDESALVLLEKIKAEKAKIKKNYLDYSRAKIAVKARSGL